MPTTIAQLNLEILTTFASYGTKLPTTVHNCGQVTRLNELETLFTIAQSNSLEDYINPFTIAQNISLEDYAQNIKRSFNLIKFKSKMLEIGSIKN